MNNASLIGPKRFNWWPDWRGECTAIIASGASTKKDDVDKSKGRVHVIAIKKNVELCPWAEVVYGCDDAWWASVNSLPNYKGIKLSQGHTASKNLNTPRVEVKTAHKILLDDPLIVGSGGNSGFQALNLAIQFGATGILLIGYDMNGDHWYGRNTWQNSSNPISYNFNLWKTAFNGVSNDIRLKGIDVVDTASAGYLTCFRKATVDQALSQWGL